MLTEEKFKINLIKSLNKINKGWIDGDKEDEHNKTVDIINHNLKIAVEIKDAIRSEYKAKKNGVSSYNMSVINKRLRGGIEDANRKFKEKKYKNYKTVLIFRTNLPLDCFYQSVQGIYTFVNSRKITSSPPGKWLMSEGLEYIGRKGKHQRHEMGAFIVFTEDGDFSYFKNQYANMKEERFIGIEKINELFGFDFKDLDKDN